MAQKHISTGLLLDCFFYFRPIHWAYMHTHHALFGLAMALTMIGAGCGAPQGLGRENTAVSAAPPAWQAIGGPIERLEFSPNSTPHAKIILYRVNPQKVRMRFGVSKEPKFVRQWAEAFPDALIIANGVYFNEDFSPTGMLVASSTRVGKGQFDRERSGFLILSPKFRIADTKKETVDVHTLVEAGQSYPFLIKGGAAALAKDSGLRARRTFIGEDAEGRAYLGIVSNAEITLFALMQTLRDADIPWRHVLNLDGGPSSGLAARHGGQSSGNFSSGNLEIFNSHTPVPNVMVVEPTSLSF